MTNRTLLIPTSLELHGITYRTVMKNDLVISSDNMGEASYRMNEIILQAIIPGAPMTEDRQGQVFCHELTHHILREMHNKLRDDEGFVDLFSSLLHQALITAEYKPEAQA